MVDSKHQLASIEILLSRITSMETTLSKIFKILNGNGGEGLVTKVALHEQKIEEIPSPSNLRWYAGIGGGVVTFFSLLVYVILRMFSSSSGGG